MSTEQVIQELTDPVETNTALDGLVEPAESVSVDDLFNDNTPPADVPAEAPPVEGGEPKVDLDNMSAEELDAIIEGGAKEDTNKPEPVAEVQEKADTPPEFFDLTDDEHFMADKKQVRLPVSWDEEGKATEFKTHTEYKEYINELNTKASRDIDQARVDEILAEHTQKFDDQVANLKELYISAVTKERDVFQVTYHQKSDEINNIQGQLDTLRVSNPENVDLVALETRLNTLKNEREEARINYHNEDGRIKSEMEKQRQAQPSYEDAIKEGQAKQLKFIEEHPELSTIYKDDKKVQDLSQFVGQELTKVHGEGKIVGDNFVNYVRNLMTDPLGLHLVNLAFQGAKVQESSKTLEAPVVVEQAAPQPSTSAQESGRKSFRGLPADKKDSAADDILEQAGLA